MGETNSSPFSFGFNGSIRVETRGVNLSANAGGLILREADEKLDFCNDLAGLILDPRNPDLITHPISELLRARIFALALGYTDQDDLDFLRDDPVLRLTVSERRGTSPLDSPGEDEQIPDGLASQPTQSRLVKTLSSDYNLEVLNDYLLTTAEREFAALGLSGPVVLDIDSFPIQVYGSQPDSNYSGYYHMRCFNPLITMLSETSAVLRADLRPGSTWTSTGAVEHLAHVFDQATESFGGVKAVRGDAGFPDEPFCSFLETRNVPYALRLKTNDVLKELAWPYLGTPPDRSENEPLRTWYYELSYQAGTWSKSRRVVLVVLERPGELFVDHFFLLTKYTPEQMSPQALLEFYRQRGTMERHIGEIKSTLCPTLSSAPRPKSHYKGELPKRRIEPIDGARVNAATFLLYMLGYNLMNIVRNLMASTQPSEEPVPSLDRIRTHVLKVTTRLTRTARYAVFIVNETCRTIWEAILGRIAQINAATQLE